MVYLLVLGIKKESGSWYMQEEFDSKILCEQDTPAKVDDEI